MSEYIEVGQPLQFTDPNTPTRVGEIVENVSDIYNIPSPHLGMQVFVKSEKKSFVITSLKSKVVNGVDVPEAAVEAFEAVGAKSITWNNDTDPSNMNDFVVAGVYDIKGEHTREDDNLPILNTGGGHSFNARLTVLDSSISGSGNSDDKCITQVLSFSNRLGQGEVYIRTGKGSSLYNLTWENWSTLQRNVNVGEVGSLDDLKDNGIYSGVWKQGRINPNYLAFVCIVINDYFIGIAPRRVSQFVYGLSKSDGSVVYQSRVWDDSKGMWGNWEILNQKEIASMISAEIKKVTDGVDPNKIDSLKDIITWIEEHGDVAGILAAIEGLYDELGREIDARMSVDNDTRGKGVLFGGFSNRQTTADEVVIGYKNIAQNAEGAFAIPAATTEKAGVMSAEDKVKISAILGNMKTQVIEVQSYYVISPLPSILKTSYTLTELIKPQGAVVYLAVGESNKLKITEDMLPYTLSQDYNGVSSSKGGTVSIIYSEEPIPQKGKVQELEILVDTNTTEIETLKTDVKTQADDTNKLNLTVYGTIRELSVDGKKSYQAVALPVPLGKGYIITEMNASDSVVWLSKTGGNADIKITELPLVLKDEYKFLMSNKDILISLRYTQGEEPKESIDKVVKNLEQRVFDAETSLAAVRKVIYVKKTDQDIELFLKMKQAFDEGYCDVIFECGTYTIKEAYKYMYEQYLWRDKNGLPLGDGCRYYFNGSTIIGENSTESAGVEISCNILDSVRRASSYEVHDVTLVNNVEDADNYKKTYCIHDESDGSIIPYIRRYNNVRCVNRERMFGCGTGFDSKIILENCEFIHTEDITAKLSKNIAIHGVISSMNPNNDFQQLRVSLLNCYFNNNGVPVHINSSTFTSNEDNVELKMVGCKCGSNLNSETINVCNKLVQYNNDINPYQ